ncbi:hypothetical protein B0J13DRAFT_182544 [Dactylonectria estremocensis]|uniref:Uncharacterized protein n=1 Tax=Dactylonectria estremocensis TaxID=1079267 RepID=A0A9P9JF32_9HYPO|nr:hypothetical protein B0J13DRAFT_182544 [Dactylonectria estremocensis]
MDTSVIPEDQQREEERRLEVERQREEERRQQEEEESCWYGYPDSAVYLSPDLVPRVTSGPEFIAELRHQKARLRESVSHDLLIKEGGRAWYPFERLLEVSRLPREFAQMLRYWQGEVHGSNPDSWMVFTPQLARWRKFRSWQKLMREIHPNFYEYVSSTKSYLTKYSTQDMADMVVALEKDPRDQDQLATWIEYLSYEMRGYYGIAWCKSKTSQYHHTAAWRKRANPGALTRRLTRTYIENPVYDQGRSRGLRRLHKSAESERLALMMRARRESPRSTRQRPALSRRRSLDEEDLDWSIKRSDSNGGWGNKMEKYLDTTESFRIARRKVRHQDILLEWIRSEAYKIRNELDAVRERELAAIRERELAALREQQRDIERECVERLARIETILFGPDISLHPSVQHSQSIQAAAQASQLKRPRIPSQEPEDAPREKAVCLHSTQFSVNLAFRPRTLEEARDDAKGADASGADAASSADADTSIDDAPSAASGSPDDEN